MILVVLTILKVSFTGFDIKNYVDLLQASTDSILSSAIAVVYIFDASMYPSQVHLSITLAPDQQYQPTIFHVWSRWGVGRRQ